ncbi:MAG: nucleotidyl transferase AbiEii/AbiGii toxin family protein [Caldilineales bacterium]|nr:nucleotidyl transferase AbiEii/AbiGii toxin family protein [Caldilineales bacterium]
MLTRTQIQRLAQRQRIGMQAQERDYLQHLLLLALTGRTQDLIFKGGTALRLVYRGNRFSEDLDFNVAADTDSLHATASLHALWQQIADDLTDFGIVTELRNEWEGGSGYSFDVSYRGPLYDGRDRSKGKVRVDISRRMESVMTQRELVHSEYDDVRPFVITVLTPEHLLAEKIRALIIRAKPRDLYDVWLLVGQNVRLERSLVDQKLALYDITLTADRLTAALDRAVDEWERDLRPLLPQYVEAKVALRGLAPLHDLVGSI